jgi:hypothetical protein
VAYQIERNDVGAALRVVREYQDATRVFPLSGIEIPLDVKDVDPLLTQDHADLELGREAQRAVAIALTVGKLLGESQADIAQRLLDVTGETVPCPSLRGFLKNPCGGYASGFRHDEPWDLAELYVHTMLFQASGERDLAGLMKDREYGIGVRILNTPDDGCRVCNEGQLVYRWREIAAIPKLPRHWGCRCCYTIASGDE